MADRVTLRCITAEALAKIPLLDAIVGPSAVVTACGPGSLGDPSSTILENGYGAPGDDTHYYLRSFYSFEQDSGGSYGGGGQAREGAFTGWANTISLDTDIQRFLDGTG